MQTISSNKQNYVLDSFIYQGNEYYHEEPSITLPEKIDYNERMECSRDLQLVSSTTSPTQIPYKYGSSGVSREHQIVSEHWVPGETVEYSNSYPKQVSQLEKRNSRRNLQVHICY